MIIDACVICDQKGATLLILGLKDKVKLGKFEYVPAGGGVGVFVNFITGFIDVSVI